MMSKLLFLPVASQIFSPQDLAELAQGFLQGNNKEVVKENREQNYCDCSREKYTWKLGKWPIVGFFIVGIFFFSQVSTQWAVLSLFSIGLSIILLVTGSISLLVFYLRVSGSLSYLNRPIFAKYADLMNKGQDAMVMDEDSVSVVSSVIESLDGSEYSFIQNPNITSNEPRNDKVFLTGATGFVGSLLLRDLLLHRVSLGICGGVILLVRRKRDQSPHERVERLLAQPMFSFLSEQEKSDLVHVVEGDVAEEALGLNKRDEESLLRDRRISHVFHSAASVSFKQDLSSAAKMNISASLHVQGFCKQLARADAKFIHISTAFVHGGEMGSKESPLSQNLYHLGRYDPMKLYQSMIGTQLYASNAMDDLGFPNTYAFSKCICEHLLLRDQDVDTLIIRPSIIGPSVESPFEGWAGNKPSTLVAATCFVMTFKWSFWGFGSHSIPIIPVDVLSQYILAKSFLSKTDEPPSDTSVRSLEIVSGEGSFCDGQPSLDLGCIQQDNIYNAAWNDQNGSLLDWDFYVDTLCQFAPIVGYAHRLEAYFASILGPRILSSLNPQSKFFPSIHSFLCHGPAKALLWLFKLLGLESQGFEKATAFLDLPVLFFPFMKGSFFFDSELSVPKDFKREWYAVNCAFAAHRFLKGVDAIKSTGLQNDMKALQIGGKLHRNLLPDILWAASQPVGDFLTRAAGYIFTKILRCTCSSVTVDLESFSRLVDIADSEGPQKSIVLAPTHRSFFDFILLSYLIFSIPELSFEIPFIIAADEFEGIPLLGIFAGYLRAIFVKRGRARREVELAEKIAHLQSNKLNKSKIPIEVFLEGQRSRDRRFVEPRRGFLRCLAEAGGNYTIVPITINYERLPEQSVLADEIDSHRRRNLSLLGCLKWLQVCLCAMKGLVFQQLSQGFISQPFAVICSMLPSVESSSGIFTLLLENHLIMANKINLIYLRL